jgi:phage baseplate assembly protein gpV
MDYTKADDMQNDSQLSGSMDDAVIEYLESRLRDLHTSVPGIIVSFNAAKQTATVQPAIKRIFVEDGPVNLPVCTDVPVKFPGGGGFFLTFPVKAGDECELKFSERAIDFWYQNGAVQLPSEYRMHDLSDAIADVGLNSQPNVIPTLCTTGAELRTRDGSTFLRMEAGTITIQGNVILKGNLTQTGDTTQTGNLTQTGSQTVSGSVTASGDVKAQGTSVHTHTHMNVKAGTDNTGVPN